MTDKHLLYLYDLPKDLVTSTKIAQLVAQQVQTDNIEIPQIRRDNNRPFYAALVKFNDPETFKTAIQKLRYFEMEGKPCRALPFDKAFLGSNRQKTNENNIFVKSLDKSLTSKDLEEKFKDIGEIKSAKVSINPDYSSRGYGFVCFASSEDAIKAVGEKIHADIEVLHYNPKDRRDMRKLFNNIYVKNFPTSWDEAKLKEVFGQHGEIKSLFRMEKEIPGTDGQKAPFAFICFDKEGDKEYGPKCASSAVNDLNGKVIDAEHTLYVREALKKQDREVEKKKEQMRFKQSKKRCNLYVKNFPPTTTEDELKEFFSKVGELESVKIFSREGEALYAFVCYKNPEHAAQAKIALHQ